MEPSIERNESKHFRVGPFQILKINLCCVETQQALYANSSVLRESVH